MNTRTHPLWSTQFRRCVLLVVFLAHGDFALHGEPVEEPGLDVIVVLDRSGSISPQTRRSYRDALSLLTSTLAFRESTRLSHRLAVISFGSRARVEVPFTRVDAPGAKKLSARVSRLETTSLGNTDFPEAFALAIHLMQSLRADASRKRAIVLLTDGAAFTPGRKAQESFAEIERLLERSYSDATLDVVLIGGADHAPAWERIEGSRARVTAVDRYDLLATLHEALIERIGTRGTQTEISGASETIVLPPYLDLVVFDVVRGRSTRPIAIVPPDSIRPLAIPGPGVEEISLSPYLSTVVVRHPRPGVWTFRKPDAGARVRVLSQQFFPRGFLVQPSAVPPLKARDAISIEYQLTDGSGTPLHEVPGFPVSVDVSLAAPGDLRTPLAMAREAATSSYRSANATICDRAGQYWAEVRVNTVDSNGDRICVLDDRWSGFVVHENTDTANPSFRPGLAVRASAASTVRGAPFALFNRDSREWWGYGSAAFMVIAAVWFLSRRR